MLEIISAVIASSVLTICGLYVIARMRVRVQKSTTGTYLQGHDLDIWNYLGSTDIHFTNEKNEQTSTATVYMFAKKENDNIRSYTIRSSSEYLESVYRQQHKWIWHNLAQWKAGWVVDWYEKKPTSFGLDADRKRFLGALADEATKTGFKSLVEGIREWEDITGEDSSAPGCPCCGQPHSFTFKDANGKYEYGSKISYDEDEW